jgi:hypothetical protein
MARETNIDKAQEDELRSMEKSLKESDRQEDKDWKTDTDSAAFGRKRINIPDRW